MADDITYTSTSPAGPANGTKQVTDEHATRGHMPVVKQAVSADGDATLVPATAADGLLVNLGTNNDVTVTGSVAVTDGGGSVTVDNAALAVTGGGVEAAALRVTIANDSTGVVSVDDNGGSLTVDGTVGVSGTVTVSDGGGSLTVDGTVSVTEPVSVDDNGGSLTVDDGGGSLTVDGSVTVSGSVTADTELPTAAALTDTDGNPTAPTVGAAGMVWTGAAWARARGQTGDGAAATGMQNILPMMYNGATHDRLRGDTTNGLLVNLGTNNDVVVSDGGGSITVDGTVSVSEPVSVDDNGSSLTVDAPVGTPVNVQVGDGSNTATVRNLAANDALNVAIVDGSGNHVTSFGGTGGTSMTDDAAFTPASTAITPVGGTYRSTRDAVDDGDAGALAITANRAVLAALETPAGDSAMDDTNDAVRVNVVAGSSGGPSKTDDAAFTVGSDSVAPMGALVDETTPDSADEGDVGIPRMSANRNLYGQIRDGQGNERSAYVTAGNALKVDGSAVTQPVSDGGATLSVDDGGSSLTVDNAALSVTGGGVEASALRVTIASDSTGVVSVDDNGASLSVDDGGASLTVDGTVTANAGTGFPPVVTDGAAAGTTGVHVLGTDGTNAQLLSTNASGHVNIADGGNSITVDGTVAVSGTVTVDTELPAAAALADNTANPTAPAVAAHGMVYDGSTWDRAPGNSTDGQLVNLGANNDVTVTGTVTANAGSGPFPVSDNGGSLTVDNPALSVTGGGVEASALRVTVASDSTGVLSVDDNGGSLTVDGTVTANLAAGTNNIGDVDIASAPTGGSSIQNQGAAAHDAAVAGNPLAIGMRANANEPTAVSADGDAVWAWADLLGRQVVLTGHPNPEAPVSVNATASGNSTVIAAPGASISIYVCKASVHNRATTNRVVSLTDGAGGTTRWRAELAAEGGGALIDFGARGWKLTANTLLNVNLDAAGDVDVNITEYYLAA